MPAPIHTSRLLLREFLPTEAQLVWELNRLPEVTRYVHEARISTIEQAEEILLQIILPQYQIQLGRLAVFIKATGHFAGWCGLKKFPGSTAIDLGYRYMPQYWGQGYAAEAAAAILEYGFKHLQLPAIHAKVHPENLASEKVLQKIGMQYLTQEWEEGQQIKVYIATLAKPS